MTLQEVTDVASVLIGKSVDTALANRFLNEGLRLLIARYPTACPIKCLRVLWQADTDPYPMPAHRGIYKIYRNKQLYGDYRLDEEGKPKTYMLYGHVHDTVDQRLLETFQEIVRNTVSTDAQGNTRNIPCNMINCFCKYSDYEPLTLDEWIECDQKRRNRMNKKVYE